MELQGYEPYVGNQPRVITSQDKLVRTNKDGTETVINVLLTRRTNLICRAEGAPSKFELFFTTWNSAFSASRRLRSSAVSETVTLVKLAK